MEAETILVIWLICEHGGEVGREIFSFPTRKAAELTLKDMKKVAKRDGLKLKSQIGGPEVLEQFEPIH